MSSTSARVLSANARHSFASFTTGTAGMRASQYSMTSLTVCRGPMTGLPRYGREVRVGGGEGRGEQGRDRDEEQAKCHGFIRWGAGSGRQTATF